MLTTGAASKTFTSTPAHSIVVEASGNWTNSDFCLKINVERVTAFCVFLVSFCV